MKKIKQLFYILTVVLLSFASCKSSSTVINGDLAATVPSNAIFVVNINAKQIVDKGELNKFKNFDLYSLMRSEIAIESENAAKMVDEFLSNTRSSGLNLDQILIYSTEGDEGVDMFIVTGIDNLKTFESKLRELISSNNGDFEPVNKNGYKQLTLDYQTEIVWNEAFLYFINNGSYSWYDDDDEERNYDYLFANKTANLLSTYDDFGKFIDNSYDVGFWMSYDKIMEFAGSSSGYNPIDFAKLIPIDINGLYVHAYLNFEKGEVKMGALASPKEKMDEFYKIYPLIKKDFDSDLLKYFPDNSYSVGKVSVNVQEYIRLMKDQFAKLSEVMKKNNDYEYYGYDPMADFNRMFDDEMFKKISDGLEGDAVFSLYDFQQGIIPMPMAALIFNVKSKDVFDLIIAQIPDDVLKKNGEYYALMQGPMALAYMAYKDNKIYITTDQNGVSSFMDKGFSKNLNNSEYERNLKNDIFYWNLNVDLASYPEHISMMLRSQLGREYRILESFMKIYKVVEYRLSKDTELELIVKMQNESNNSLKVILKNLDENIPALFR